MVRPTIPVPIIGLVAPIAAPGCNHPWSSNLPHGGGGGGGSRRALIRGVSELFIPENAKIQHFLTIKTIIVFDFFFFF